MFAKDILHLPIFSLGRRRPAVLLHLPLYLEAPRVAGRPHGGRAGVGQRLEDPHVNALHARGGGGYRVGAGGAGAAGGEAQLVHHAGNNLREAKNARTWVISFETTYAITAGGI